MTKQFPSNSPLFDILKANNEACEHLNYMLRRFCDCPEYAYKLFDKIDIANSTATQYKKCIKEFLNYIDTRTIDFDIYLNYKKHLSERKDIKVSTKNVYLSTAAVFLKELSRQGFVKDITANVKHFRQDKKHKRFGHNRDEIRRLYDKLQDLPVTTKNTRMSGIFHLAALQGLREIEISRLDVDDVNTDKGLLMVQGKGKDDKEPIYLAELTKLSLKKHIEHNSLKSGPLFFSLSRRTMGNRITTRTIRYLYDDLKKDMGINASMHGFRHFFTTELIKKGVPLNKVQMLTRHKSLSMLQVYNDEILNEEDSKHIFEDFVSNIFDI